MDRKKIAALVQEAMGSEYTVMEAEMQKVNGITLHGVSIRRAADNVAPVIYYRDEWAPEENVVEKILAEYEASLDRIEQLNIAALLDRGKILSRVHRKLIQSATNEAYAADKVRSTFLDMTVVYYIALNDNCSVTVTPDILNRYGISELELDAAATANDRSAAQIIDMNALMREMGVDTPEADEDPQLIVITNTRRQYGACTMMFPECMAQVSEAFGYSDFYILPSSLHEVIATKAGPEAEADTLKGMVRSINSTEVAPEDQLGDSIYLWNREKGHIEVVL